MMFTEQDFTKAILALFPSGSIWQRRQNGLLYKISYLLAKVFARSTDDAFNLLTDAFPASAQNLLPEWEKTLGLPDECLGDNQTIGQRQKSVISKLTDNGGSSKKYYIFLAKNIGFTIKIEEFCEAKAGLLKAGNPVYGKEWNYVWRITVPPLMYSYFRAGSGKAGDALRTWQRQMLACILNEHISEHTILIFREVKI